MNAQRRKAIGEARALVEAAFEKLEEARSMLSDLQSEEQDYYDNMPESLQGGEKGEKAQAAADALQEAHDNIDGLDFESVYSALDTAVE